MIVYKVQSFSNKDISIRIGAKFSFQIFFK